jgi:hypothetical protein
LAALRSKAICFLFWLLTQQGKKIVLVFVFIHQSRLPRNQENDQEDALVKEAYGKL